MQLNDRHAAKRRDPTFLIADARRHQARRQEPAAEM
jgi:hypothetical protein